MKHAPLLIAIIALFAGCGSDIDKKIPPKNDANNGVNNGGSNNSGSNNSGSNNVSSNNGPSNNVSTNNADSNNGSSNNGGSNNGTTNPDGPCVVVEPNSVSFGFVSVGGSAGDSFTLENCSRSEPVELQGSVDDGPFTILLPELAMLQPLQSVNVPISFAPTATGEYAGTLSVLTSVGQLDVAVSGTATGDSETCPIAVAKVRLEDGSSATAATVSIGDTTFFQGEESYGRGAQVANYEWSLVAKPPGSTAQLLPTPNVSNPSIVPDVPGDYTAELVVVDANAEESCDRSRATITAVAAPAEADVTIKLTWDTDLTDLDLHYLHPSGNWSDAQWDCHWANKEPEWGAAGNADDPSVDLDDISGFGPENITHSGLENRVYSVGVHFYSRAGQTQPTRPTTRIYVDGNLELEDVGVALAEIAFRFVARIDGGNKTVTAVGTVTPDFPTP